MSLSKRKIKVGKVISNRMDETIIVTTQWRLPHPKYKKPVRRQSKFKADDPDNQCRVGDMVKIIETRPVSKTKRWRVLDILIREESTEIEPEEVSRGNATAIMSEVVPKQDPATNITESQVQPQELIKDSKGNPLQNDTKDESPVKPKRKAKTKASTADAKEPEATTEKEDPTSIADTESVGAANKTSSAKPIRKAETKASTADAKEPEATTEKEDPTSIADTEKDKK